ncbi:hypothetical protein GCM10022223_49030 [Kineosporia mesophila]|uniref:DUF4157 domain-containing protein n=1 Tax=Kineosporia mesophila TaxID=566012 RepID=A0ABP7A6U3_9ACTN|nr:hypothetical protein [Kineosporia mesophila]MCD5351591.1 hypothetical protein [Kineosporia mesophila]
MRRLLPIGAFVLLVALTFALTGGNGTGTTVPAATRNPGTSTAPRTTAGASSTSSTMSAQVTATSSRCRVAGPAVTRTLVNELAALCVRSARTVDRAWGEEWGGVLTRLVVAGDINELAGLLGRDDTKGLTDTAAVTVGPHDAPADAVFINGPAFDGLTDLGRQVVLTHELVHVAARAAGDSDAPLWLEEGYADYVAYRGTGLSAREIAGEALAAPLPQSLPAVDDFDASDAGAAVAYGQAWVAVTVLADRLGSDAALKRLYEKAAHSGTDEALRSAGFVSRTALVRAVRQRMTHLDR